MKTKKVTVDNKFEVFKLFCPRCGKEMRTLQDCVERWNRLRIYPLDCLKVCSDCLLKEIREDNEV